MARLQGSFQIPGNPKLGGLGRLALNSGDRAAAAGAGVISVGASGFQGLSGGGHAILSDTAGNPSRRHRALFKGAAS